jgi:hypothetical protein
MSKKNACMEIKAGKFEAIGYEQAMEINGGVTGNPRTEISVIISGIIKVINFFS